MKETSDASRLRRFLKRFDLPGRITANKDTALCPRACKGLLLWQLLVCGEFIKYVCNRNTGVEKGKSQVIFVYFGSIITSVLEHLLGGTYANL